MKHLLPRLRNPEETSVVIVTLAEATPLRGFPIERGLEASKYPYKMVGDQSELRCNADNGSGVTRPSEFGGTMDLTNQRNIGKSQRDYSVGTGGN